MVAYRPRLVLRQRMRTRSRIQFLQGPVCSFRSRTPADRMASQVYAILDEIFLAGEIEETSKDVVLSRLEELEKLE